MSEPSADALTLIVDFLQQKHLNSTAAALEKELNSLGESLSNGTPRSKLESLLSKLASQPVRSSNDNTATGPVNKITISSDKPSKSPVLDAVPEEDDEAESSLSPSPRQANASRPVAVPKNPTAATSPSALLQDQPQSQSGSAGSGGTPLTSGSVGTSSTTKGGIFAGLVASSVNTDSSSSEGSSNGHGRISKASDSKAAAKLSSSFSGLSAAKRFLKEDLLARARRLSTSTGHFRGPTAMYDEDDVEDRKTGSLSMISSHSSANSSLLSSITSERRRSRTSSVGEESRLSPAVLEALAKQHQQSQLNSNALSSALSKIPPGTTLPTAAALALISQDSHDGTPASNAFLSESTSVASVDEYIDDDDNGYSRVPASEFNAWSDAMKASVTIYAFASMRQNRSPSKGNRRLRAANSTMDSDSSDLSDLSDSDDIFLDDHLELSSESDYSEDEGRSNKNIADTAVMPTVIQKKLDVSTFTDPISHNNTNKPAHSPAHSLMKVTVGKNLGDKKKKKRKLVKSDSQSSQRSQSGLFEMEMDKSHQQPQPHQAAAAQPTPAIQSTAQSSSTSTFNAAPAAPNAVDLRVSDVQIPSAAVSVQGPDFADINIVYDNPTLIQRAMVDNEGNIVTNPLQQVNLASMGITRLEFFDMKVIYTPGKTGFEPTHDFPIRVNDIIAGRYQVVQYLGSAAFSRAVQCIDHKTGDHVCVKIIKNNKDYFDQSLDEIKLLKFIQMHGDCDENHVLRMLDYFYFKEHLFIVCELLRENLYEVYKYNRQSQKELYFTIARLQKVARQCLVALRYIHSLNLMHCDLKPENILIKSYSRSLIKVIDFGSSCFTTDQLSSYVQSRSYRAPEVVLGHQYDQRIDIWSLGCILAELWTGKVLFQNESVPTLLAKHMGIVGFTQRDCDWVRCAPLYDDFFTPAGVIYEKKSNTTEFIYPKKTSIKRRVPCEDPLFLDFVSSLLRLNPAERPTSAEALNHAWFKVEYAE